MWKDILDHYGVSAAAEYVREVYFVVISVSLGLQMHITLKYSVRFDLISGPSGQIQHLPLLIYSYQLYYLILELSHLFSCLYVPQAMLQTSSERRAIEAYESYKGPNFSNKEAQTGNNFFHLQRIIYVHYLQNVSQLISGKLVFPCSSCTSF